MSRRLTFPVLMTILGLLILRLLAARSDGLAFSREPELILNAAAILVITAFTTAVEVPLQGDALSLGYSAGLLAVLVLGERDDLFTAIGLIGLGGLFGGAIRALWRDWQNRHRPGLQTIAWALVASAQLIVSLAVGTLIYRYLGGPLPLTLSIRLIAALATLIVVSMLLYVAIYAAALWWRGLNVRQVFIDNQYTLLISLLAPIPFAITGALVIEISLVGFTILAGGLLAMAVLATELGRQRLRFRQQVTELSSLIAAREIMSQDNAKLYRQTHERSQQLFTLNDLSARLSGTLDPQRVFDLVTASTLELAGADGAAIFLWWDDTQQSLALARSAGMSESFAADPPLPVLFAGSVSADVQPLTISNRHSDPRTASAAEAMQREAYTAWIELPLRNGAEVLGALVAYYHQPHRFAAEEVELLRAYANQAALSISNARLYRRTDEALEQRIGQLSALTSINQELASTLNLQHLFALVLDHALEGTRSSNGILLLKPEMAGQNAPRIVAQRGQDFRKSTEMLRSTATRAFETNQYVIDRSGIPELSVPIARGADVLGVITLQSVEQDAYPSDAILFVRQLATQAVIAIDNARLFTRIEDSRDRLQVILDSMHEGILLIDSSGVVVLANPQIGIMFDLSPSKITGQTIEALLAHRGLNFAGQLGFEEDTLRQLVMEMQYGRWLGGNARDSYRVEKPMIRFIDRTMVSTHANTGPVIGLLLVFADATEERELTQAREDLTRMIVHDLRSPLTAISTSMRLLGEIAPQDKGLERILNRTTDASQRALRKLLNLVDSLLDIAKMESGSMTLELAEHMLAPIAYSVRMELHPLADELSITVDILIPESLPHLNIDAEKIERVLLNLVDNALKFTPIDGVVRIVARTDPVQRGFVRIEVSDTGPGIPDDYKERIFDRFQQVDGSQGRRRGTGLGLTFCKLTVEAHNGNIWIEDNSVGGSIFALTLPVYGAPEGAFSANTNLPRPTRQPS